MTRDRDIRPRLVGALLVVLGLLAFAVVGASGRRPAAASGPVPPPDPSAAALLSSLDRLHTRVEAHAIYYAGRDSWLDVGVYPVPGRAQR